MKTAIIYYSNTGNTKQIAERIAKDFSADMFYISPDKPYHGFAPSILRVVGEKIRRKHPHALTEPENFRDYDLIFLGFPVWAGTMPEFMQDYLKKCDLSGKKVIPFVTAASTGKENSLKTVKELLPDSEISNYLFASMRDKANLDSWIKGIQT